MGDAIERGDLSSTLPTRLPAPELAAGAVLLGVDRVGVTANNVTYAALVETFRYGEFFPAESGRWIVPLWGFAEVVESQADGVVAGSRHYGCYPL